nr:abscisic acid 8'-hydroxylase 2-like [Tanacetum cinerariifolium]
MCVVSLEPPHFVLSPFLGFLLLVTFVFSFIKWRGGVAKNGNRRLPPGSMGWPYIGETLGLYTQNPNSFFSKRQTRYGNIFKSHILGCPCVMISSPEVAKIVLVRSILPSAIKGLVHKIEGIVLNLLPTWVNTNTLNTLSEMKKYSYEVAMISIFGKKLEVDEMEGLKHLYLCIEKGYNSMPLDLPGTPFKKAMKARKLLNVRLRKMIEERQENEDLGGGLLGVLLGLKGENHDSLSVYRLLIIGVIFAAHDTTASALTWLLKYLHDHPHLLDAVKMEQEAIKCQRLETNRGITWDDTRHMPVTTQVLQETLRTASIISFTFREAVEDVEIEGFLIPRGWKVLPLFRTIHYSSDFFPDPDKFDPSRFKVAPRANTFMPFGNGAHSSSKMTYGKSGYFFRREPRGGVEHAQFVSMLEKVEGTMVADTGDRWVWSLEGSGEFFVASVRRLIDDNMFSEVASKTRWIK